MEEILISTQKYRKLYDTNILEKNKILLKYLDEDSDFLNSDDLASLDNKFGTLN